MAAHAQVATPSGAPEDARGDKVGGVLEALNEVQDVELFCERSQSERLDGWPFAVRAGAQLSVCLLLLHFIAVSLLVVPVII